MALDPRCGRETSDDDLSPAAEAQRPRHRLGIGLDYPDRGGGRALEREIKRLKMQDLEFANEALTPEGKAVDSSAPTRLKAAARAKAAERFRKGRRR